MKLIVRDYEEWVNTDKKVSASAKEFDFDEVSIECFENDTNPEDKWYSYMARMTFARLPVSTSTSYKANINVCNDRSSSSSSTVYGLELMVDICAKYDKKITLDRFTKTISEEFDRHMSNTVEKGLPFVIRARDINLNAYYCPGETANTVEKSVSYYTRTMH